MVILKTHVSKRILPSIVASRKFEISTGNFDAAVEYAAQEVALFSRRLVWSLDLAGVSTSAPSERSVWVPSDARQSLRKVPVALILFQRFLSRCKAVSSRSVLLEFYGGAVGEDFGRALADH